MFMFDSGQVTTISDQLLQSLSIELRDEWTFLGKELGYEDQHLQEYNAIAKNSGNLPSYCMLRGWQSGLRPDVDEIGILIEALEEINRGDVIDMILYV